MIGRKGAGKKHLRENSSSGSSCSLEKRKEKAEAESRVFRIAGARRSAGRELCSPLFFSCV